MFIVFFEDYDLKPHGFGQIEYPTREAAESFRDKHLSVNPRNTCQIIEIAGPSMENNTNVPNLEDYEMDEVENLEGLLADVRDVEEEVPMDQEAKSEPEPLSVRRKLLDDAADLVDGDRNVQYGDPRSDFKRTAEYWNTHISGVIDRKLAESEGQLSTQHILDAHDVAVLIGLLKISRLSWSPAKEDNWVDLAGYAACGWHCAMPEEDGV